MHVAIIGMGALGRVYGVRLAARTACTVTFIVREGRAGVAPGLLRLKRIDGDGAVDVLESPVLETRPRGDADVLLLCVRVEQLDGALDAALAGSPDVPVVVLTPLLPHDLERLLHLYGDRIRPAMPGAVAYLTADGTCRYWLPKVAPTLIDAKAPVSEELRAFVRDLETAGFGVRLELGVHETNPATTVSFIPLAMGIDAAGGIDALLADRDLLRVSLDAVGEGIALAAKVGRAPAWVDLLARFAGPTSLKLGIGLARSRAPEVLAYVEEHFGRKLHAQNVVMARAIVALADERGTPARSLRALLSRLEAAS